MNDMLTLRPAQPYTYHPFSEIWPLLEGEEFDNLALDIAANGLLLPILLYQDKILDGRNRDRACVEAGVEPRYEHATAKDDESALELVFSLNQHRRHLTFEERAFAAARYANMREGAPKGNTNYLGETTLSRDRVDLPKGISVADAAKKFDVSDATVHRARQVIKHGDEQLEEDVKLKRIKLRVAAEKVTPKRGRGRPLGSGLPVASRVPVIDTSKRRVLTPEQVDPEFIGTPLEFTTKYGHVQIETAEERARNRFKEWTIHINKWARDWKRDFPLSEIDVNWLRSPDQKDVMRFLEAYRTLALVFDNIQSIRDKVKSLQPKADNS